MMPGQWEGSCDAIGRQVVPLCDLRPHVTDEHREQCWCRPQWDENVLVHNSMDQREQIERGDKAVVMETPDNQRSPAKILIERVREILSDEKRWTQKNVYAEDAAGLTVPYHSKDATAFSLQGAFSHTLGFFFHNDPEKVHSRAWATLMVEREARKRLEFVTQTFYDCDDRISHADLMAVLDAAIEALQ